MKRIVMVIAFSAIWVGMTAIDGCHDGRANRRLNQNFTVYPCGPSDIGNPQCSQGGQSPIVTGPTGPTDGEEVEESCMPAGLLFNRTDPSVGKETVCCEGLTELMVDAEPLPNGSCPTMHDDMGADKICSDCGDDKCDIGETVCNCEADCALPADTEAPPPAGKK